MFYQQRKKKPHKENCQSTLQKFARLAEMLNELIVLYCKGLGKELAGNCKGVAKLILQRGV